MKNIVAVVFGFAILGFASAVSAQNFYDNRGVFQNANPGLQYEKFDNTNDFESGCTDISPWNIVFGGDCFPPGGLLEGMSYSAVGQGSANLMVRSPRRSPQLGPSIGIHHLVLEPFPIGPGTHAIGFDYSCHYLSSFVANVYGEQGLIGSEVRTCGSRLFFGVDTEEPIVRLEIQPESHITIDNVEFEYGDPVPRPMNATFPVWLDFEDDNPVEARVWLRCNTGLPLEQSALIRDPDTLEQADPARGNSDNDPQVIFVVTDFENGQMDCELYQDRVEGYGRATSNFGVTGVYRCEYENVSYGYPQECRFYNILHSVVIRAHKVWMDEEADSNSGYQAIADYGCTNAFSQNIEGTLEFDGNPATDFFTVRPSWDGGTTCSINETVPANGDIKVDESECQSMTVFPGVGASCTIYNTRLYQGIPALSHISLLLLTSLFLATGVFFGRNRI